MAADAKAVELGQQRDDLNFPENYDRLKHFYRNGGEGGNAEDTGDVSDIVPKADVVNKPIMYVQKTQTTLTGDIII